MTTAPNDTIDHGTHRGYGQHLRRGVRPCTACRAANSARERERKARVRAASGASAVQRAWNQGAVGVPVPGREVPTGRDCSVDGCGAHGSVPQPAACMVQVEWPDSREPARWYCPGPCAAYGQALAEVRALGDRRA
ncbi:hypothetical protein HHL19_36260 [Streptomyces sp. R302]|uniref:hypothetical protein n=1 Tax=unclassified Streptomyces TaxID=2593676 RepID=UPI00145D8807|nr:MULTISPECIES: hypothetical protein [unclassified Streptomyces]NML55693.1 hypothetical protein [Streptomyces sp. R301]NML83965.1 hypothetical protein [Streptomyces sp. R302]